MLPSASDAAVRDCGEINVVTHSSALFKKGVNIVQLLLILKEKKKRVFRVSEHSAWRSHRQTALHSCELADSLLFMADIFHFFHRVRGESSSCPPPIQSSSHSVLHKNVSLELF